MRRVLITLSLPVGIVILALLALISTKKGSPLYEEGRDKHQPKEQSLDFNKKSEKVDGLEKPKTTVLRSFIMQQLTLRDSLFASQRKKAMAK